MTFKYANLISLHLTFRWIVLNDPSTFNFICHEPAVVMPQPNWTVRE